MSASVPTLLIALLGGLLPALLWLWFFLHEDPHPEPRAKLAETFIAGIIAVFFALGLEYLVQPVLFSDTSAAVLLLWSFIEEGLKLVAAWLVALRMNVFDEPVDAIVYLLTVALGFAALENTLFLISPISEAAYLNTLLTGSLRFVGATLLHVVTSGILGASLALSYYRRARIQRRAVGIGLMAATALHWWFNLLIIDISQTALLQVFLVVWVGVISLMLLFERAKRLEISHS